MALFAIGDLHLSLGCDKPMDVFTGWEGYVQKLETAWREQIKPDDTVLLAGDISWAMKLENTLQDFTFLQSLPGKKILLKGNHDYWWNTVSKMQRFLDENELNSISFLYNNHYEIGNICICGTRSWLFEPNEQQDIKVMQREIGRLRFSLESAQQHSPEKEKVVFLHYPPLFANLSSPEIISLMKEYGVRRCFYGHLHGKSIRWAIQHKVEGIEYKLISADALNFIPFKIDTN